MVLRAWVRVSAAIVLAALTASCSAAAAPTLVPAASVVPSPLASASPTSSPAVPSPSLASSSPAGAHGSASPDVVAMVETYSDYFTGTIRLLDVADGDLAVTVSFIDSSSAKPDPLGTYSLGPSGEQSDSVPPGTYRLEFRQPPGSTTGPTCTITVKDGDVFTFVAVPGAIAVSRAGYKPTKAGDLFVSTSALCRKEGA